MPRRGGLVRKVGWGNIPIGKRSPALSNVVWFGERGKGGTTVRARAALHYTLCNYHCVDGDRRAASSMINDGWPASRKSASAGGSCLCKYKSPQK